MNKWTSFAILGMACALVIGFYAWSARSGTFELSGLSAQNTYYNLLVRGFRAGQLNLKTEVPPGLAQLDNPYDPIASAPYRYIQGQPLNDLSYYKGKLYLYFGITPALVLFWPYAALTGHYLLHKEATLIFCSAGFLAGAGLLVATWRRYFANVSVWIIASCLLALGLANFTPAILRRSEVYEVAISCGYALTMLALAGIWAALHDAPRQGRWLAAASLAYGLAVGARPSLLFGAAILLIPAVQAWRQERRVWPLLLAATLPIGLIGLGLMLYNVLRFDNPLDFGMHYQLPQIKFPKDFSLSYLWPNFRVAFLEPACWCGQFPFVNDIVAPSGAMVEDAFGVLTNIPLVWLALAAPLAWRGRPAEASSALRYFLGAATLLFGVCALTLCFHSTMCLRYEVEFTPALVLLAVIGFIGLERTLAGQPFWRPAVRCSWALLLAFSVAFNLFEGFEMQAREHIYLGSYLLQQGKENEALAQFQNIFETQPGNLKAHNVLGGFFLLRGRTEEAIAQFQKALAIEPHHFKANRGMAQALEGQGKVGEAIPYYREALSQKPGVPDEPEVLNNLAWILAANPDPALRNGPEAVEYAERACKLTHYEKPLLIGTLAAAYAEAGRFQEAVDTGTKAYNLARSSGLKDVAQKNEELLKLYRAGQPFHQAPKEPQATKTQ